MNEKAEIKKELTIPDEYIAVYNIIANSKNKYVTRASILAQLEKDFSYNRRLSQIVNELVNLYQLPIGGSSRKETKGYFIIKNETDRYIAGRDLYTRASSMLERYEAIQNIKLKGDNNDVQNG